MIGLIRQCSNIKVAGSLLNKQLVFAFGGHGGHEINRE